MSSTHQMSVEAWIEQARSDLGAAKWLIKGERYSYAVYLAHLALEKALKGLYRYRFEENPPVTHNLVYLVERTSLVVPDDLRAFLHQINEASVLNLYPDRLLGDIVTYDEVLAPRLVDRAHETFDWITDHLDETLQSRS